MCHRYTALAIRGITIKPSPKNIAKRLEAVGLRPISNVVDVTNYVMLALGHPLHAFDLDKLADATIIVRAGNRGETIKSLDGEMRKIDPETVVIADAKRAVALGGIIGGFDTEITSRRATFSSNARGSIRRPSGAQRGGWASRPTPRIDSNGASIRTTPLKLRNSRPGSSSRLPAAPPSRRSMSWRPRINRKRSVSGRRNCRRLLRE